jgi:uncharacterized membrane protein YjjB (DUF3815 family)
MGDMACYLYIDTQSPHTTLSAITSPPIVSASVQTPAAAPMVQNVGLGSRPSWRFFGLAAFLVSIPVFIQAPLVRQWPWVSLVLTLGWAVFGYALCRKSSNPLYGDLVLGFTWSWFAGSIYWGWFRWEPFIHLPIESIGIPFAIWALLQQRYRVGAFFYLGSLWGTAITDGYFYLLGLIPFWRQVMLVEVQESLPILQTALLQIQNASGVLWAGILILALCISGLLPLVSAKVRHGQHEVLHWWAFMGAVLSTLFVDGLFWLAVRLA